MRVAGADDVVFADVVVFARQKSIDVTRGNAERAEHHGHRRRKILAVSGAALEEEVRKRILSRRTGKIEGIAVASLQIRFDCGSFVVGGGSGNRNLARQCAYARVELGKLQIDVADFSRIPGRGRAALLRTDRWHQ